jgi:hypothetical protein
MHELASVWIRASQADVVAEAHAAFRIHHEAILAAAVEAILSRIGDEPSTLPIQAADPFAGQIDGRDPEATLGILDASVHPVAAQNIVEAVDREAGAVESHQTTPVRPQPQLALPILNDRGDAGRGQTVHD